MCSITYGQKILPYIYLCIIYAFNRMTKGMDTVGFVFLFPDFVYFLFLNIKEKISKDRFV